MANFFNPLPLQWLYEKAQLQNVVNVLNRLANPKSYVYAGLKETITGGIFNDTTETVEISMGAGSDGILDGGSRLLDTSLLDGGSRV